MSRREVRTEFERRRPNLIVRLIRYVWFTIVIAFVGGIVLGMILGGWWVLPFVIVFAILTIVLVSNRRRQSSWYG